jgi:tetratricopeptide (TPR) repeat protein
MLKMIENGEASPLPLGGMIELEEQRQPAFIRRMYLQNLYRFFRLYPMRSEFASPFDDREKYLFFANPLFGKNKLQENMTEVAAFLMKHRKNDEALSVLSNCDLAANTFDYNMLMGNLLMRMPLDTELSATEYFRHALDLRPDSEKALSGYARAQFRYHHYETALTSYEKLMKLKPEHTGFMLNAAICMTNLQKNEEALKLLFKLDYEQPDNHKVKRVLAWVLTMSKRYEQAGKAYQQLLSQEKPEPVDMLNYGYCLWFQGDIMEAIVHFKQFLLTNGDENYNLEQEFMGTEHSLIASHNITDTEIYLMLDTLA